MNVGAFVCSCGDSCAVDLEGVREGITDVEVVASSSLLCEDGLDGMAHLVDEYALDQLVVTAPEPRCQSRIREVATDAGFTSNVTLDPLLGSLAYFVLAAILATGAFYRSLRV